MNCKIVQKNLIIGFHALVLSQGIAQSLTNEDEADISEFLPYQITSYLTTTLEESQFQIEPTINKDIYLVPYRKGNLWGFCDLEKNIKIEIQYDYVSAFYNNVAYVRKDNKYFFINKEGKKLSNINWVFSNEDVYGKERTLPQNTESLFLQKSKVSHTKNEKKSLNFRSQQGLLKVYNAHGRVGVVDIYENIIVPTKYDDITFGDEGMIITILDQKKGVYTREGKEICIPKYHWISNFENGLAKVSINYRHTYINTIGEEIVPSSYNVKYLKGNYIIASDRNGKKGVLDLNGDKVIPFEYKRIEILTKNFFSVEKEGRYKGIINTQSKSIQPFEYISFYPRHDKIIVAKDNKGYRFLSAKTGKLVNEKYYKDVNLLCHDCMVTSVRDDKNNYGFVDQTGKEVIPTTWYSVSSFKNGYAEVRVSSESSTTGLINSLGKLVVATKYSDIEVFEKAKMVAVRDWKTTRNKWAFIDFKGKMLTGFEYDYVTKYTNGYIAVSKNDLWGLFDDKGSMVLKCKYDSMKMVNESYLIVKNQEKYYGTLDLQGKILVPYAYDYIYKIRGGDGIAFLETAEGKQAIINKQGKFTSNVFYDKISRPSDVEQKNIFFIATQGTLKGILDASGKEIIAPKYFKLYYMIGNLAMVDITGEGKQYGYVGIDGTEYFEN